MKIRRILSASAVGGLTAVIAAYITWPLSHILLLAASALAMSAIAFGTGTLSAFLLRSCLLYAVSCTLAGVVSTFAGAFRILPFAAILFGAAAVSLFTGIFRGLISDTRKQKMLRSVRIVCGKRSADLQVLFDTGHTLRSPLTNRPVLIVTISAVFPLIPKDVLSEVSANRSDPAALFRIFQSAGFRSACLIPYHAVGISGLLCAFRPDSILCEGKPADMMVAVTDTVLSESGTYAGLMGNESFSGGYLK